MNEGVRATTLWWHSNPGDSVMVAYDADVILYHRPSGTTHLLNAASVALLSELLREPAGLDDIAAAFDSSDSELPPQDLKGRLVEMLTRLEHFGIIERIESTTE